MEKAESNHLTASSTWVSNQQTRTVGTDWQVYCLELIKKPNLNQTTTKEKKNKELKKISASPRPKFCSWLETQLVMTCTKVCVLLPGRAFIHGAVLWKSNQDTGQVQRGHPWLHPVPTDWPRPQWEARSAPSMCCHTLVSVTANCPLSSSQKGAAALSLFLSFSFVSRVPSYPRRNPETASSENRK